MDLAAWDVPSLAALRYARVGVVHGAPPALVVYHLASADPEAGLTVASASVAPPLDGGAFVLAAYRAENENRLGGHFNGFARAPARAVAAIDGAQDDRALTFTWERVAGTFAGFWIHLFETHRTPAERVWFDARALGWVTFEVRGDAGGEAVRLQVADRDQERRQDSLAVGWLADFLPAGRVTTRWQRAWVPLSALPPALDRERLASLVFLADPDGAARTAGTLRVREVAFTTEREAPAPSALGEGGVERPLRKAMWLWETRRLAATPGAVDELVAFVVAHGFTDLFLQVPFEAPEGEHWAGRFDAAGLARVVAALRAVGVRSHALDGAAWYARPEWHERVLATLDQLVVYNRSVPPAARLVGVRYDIEPYLLPEFEGHHRERVLTDYLDLLGRVAVKARAAGLALGVDIPFWFDARDEVTGELTCVVGGRPASEAIIDVVDDVGIMDYRTMAWGADGVIAHASGELAYAERVGKRVLIGLETVPLPDETLMVYDGGDRSRWDAFGDLVIEPLGGSRARLTWVPAGARREAGDYAWALPGARLLRYRDALRVPAGKITFANLRSRDLERTLERAREGLLHRASLDGFIIHSYESYRPWLEARGECRDAGEQPR
ncbi:MAG: hypothetical protein CVU56_23495 [Deltaproteobacteria bacterium HGW-Deltaproteobacteria-14]|nr:MAG: hypothetical protein CVU56_23495 [Deltaproteobacteria bacterium HGW-Deltaproteobacteria-14]